MTIPHESIRLARFTPLGWTLWIIVVAIAISVASPRIASAAQIRVPITIDYLALREALKHTLYTAPGNRAPLWNGPDQCQFLYAENPEFARAAADVKLDTATSLGM